MVSPSHSPLFTSFSCHLVSMIPPSGASHIPPLGLTYVSAVSQKAEKPWDSVNDKKKTENE